MKPRNSQGPDLFRDSPADLVARFESITSTEEFLAYFKSCVSSAGFEFFLIGGVPSAIEPVSKMILLHNYPESWVQRYIRDGYFDIDPVAQYCRINTEPFFWSEALAHFESSPGFAELMAEAATAGLKWGVCIPVHNINECEACISLAAEEQCIGEVDLPLLQLFCTYAFHKAKLLKRSELFASRNLSQREKEILTCAAAGRTAAETAAVLNVSEATVNFHLQRSMQKLGARNKVEAVAEAIRQGLIGI